MLQDLIDAGCDMDNIDIENRLNIPVRDYSPVVLPGKYIELEKLLHLHRIGNAAWYTVGVVQNISKNSFELSNLKGVGITCRNYTELVQEGHVIAIQTPIWKQSIVIREKGSIHHIGISTAVPCRRCTSLALDSLCFSHLRDSIQSMKNSRQNLKTTGSVYDIPKREFKKPDIIDKSSTDFFEFIANKNDRVSKVIKKQINLKTNKSYSNPFLQDTAFYKQQAEPKKTDSEEIEINFSE